MPHAPTVTLRRRTKFRTIFMGLVGRVIRRGFFRLVLLFFALFVAVVLAINAAANRDTANKLIESVTAGILDLDHAEITWDRERTDIRGPGLTGSGEIRVYNVRVSRIGGRTPHPARGPLEYHFLEIPEVRLAYDLKQAPDFVARVEFPEGLTTHLNVHAGRWLDADLFAAGDGSGAAPSLPEVLIGGDARVNIRADGIFVPPESLKVDTGEPSDWYEFTLREMGLLPTLGEVEEYTLSGLASADRFGAFRLGGNVRRDASRTLIQFRSSRAIEVDSDFVSILSPEIRTTVDQFQVVAKAEIRGSIDIQPSRTTRPVAFVAEIEASEGSLCFVGFPARVDDASASVIITDTRLEVRARGRRDGARISVTVLGDNIGTAQEYLTVDVGITDLLVDERLRLALLPARLQPGNAYDWVTGEPWPADQFDERNPEMALVKGYPEWPGNPTWDGGLIFPNVDPVLPFVCRAFTPIGLCNFQLKLVSTAKGRLPDGTRTIEQTLNWKVFVRQATACFTGEPEKPGAAFPVTLHGCYGVVEGITSTGTPGIYTVRGYRPEELALLGPDPIDRAKVAFDERGLFGYLESENEKVWVNAAFTERSFEDNRPRLTLKLQSEGVHFNPSFSERLPAEVRARVEEFAPRGRVDINEAKIDIRPDREGTPEYSFRLRAGGVAAIYQFADAAEPMRFSEVHGDMSLNSAGNAIELRNVRGKLLGSDLTMAMQFRNGAIDSLTVASDDFAVKDGLDKVLPSGVGEVLRTFKLSGFVEMQLSSRFGTSRPDLTDVDIRFKVGTGERSGSMQFSRFPYRLTDLTGRINVTMRGGFTYVTVADFGGRGSKDPDKDFSEVTVSGRVIIPPASPATDPDTPPEASEPIVDLHVRAARLPVDSDLLRALDTMLREPDQPEAKPAVISFIESLNASGTFGVNGRLTSTSRGEHDWRIEVLLENTVIQFDKFRYPLRDLLGTVMIDGRDVSLRNLSGRAESGNFTLHHAGFTPDGQWSILLSARDMFFHESPALRNALPQKLKDMFIRMNPKGKFDLDLELTGRNSEDGQSDFMHYKVGLDVHETDLDLGLHFEDMTARFDYEGVIDGTETRSNGQVYVRAVTFKKAVFTEVASAIQHFGDRLEFPNLRGKFYEGWLEGRFGMVGSDYTGELVVRRADLQLLGSTAFGTNNVVGVMDAEVKFHSQINSEGQIGRGRIDIGAINRLSEHPDPKVRERERECKLAAVPFFNELLRVAGGEQNFDEGHVYFWLSPDRIVIREMDFVSDTVRIEVFGDDNYIMYGSAEMRMTLYFTAFPRVVLPLPVIQQVLDWFKQVLFRFYVSGTLGEPRIEAISQAAEDLEAPVDEFPRRQRGP